MACTPNGRSDWLFGQSTCFVPRPTDFRTAFGATHLEKKMRPCAEPQSDKRIILILLRGWQHWSGTGVPILRKKIVLSRQSTPVPTEMVVYLHANRHHPHKKILSHTWTNLQMHTHTIGIEHINAHKRLTHSRPFSFPFIHSLTRSIGKKGIFCLAELEVV